MFQINEILAIDPFSIQKKEKIQLYNRALKYLNAHHYQNCSGYQSILKVLNYNSDISLSYYQHPFIPIRLFKEYELSSINEDKIFKIMHSSGTSGFQVSKVFLDRENASIQTKVLTKIVSTVLGNKRLPMLVIDSKSTIKDRTRFSARGAGILGFSMFGKDVTYALNDDDELDVKSVEDFAKRHKNQKIFVFGFTSMIWKYFVRSILEKKLKLTQLDGIMIHGGGWKKLTDQKVDNSLFKKSIFEVSGVKNVINYYGMIEQTGSIFIECSEGFLHSSIFSDIIIRRPDFSVCKFNEVGLVQLISLLPTSYPGHNIITEDLGKIIGIDDCKCGKQGKYFLIHGRAERAEIRGCSDSIE